MLHFLIRATAQNVIFPFYHIVSNDAPIHIKHLYRTKNIKEFEKDLEFLLQHFQPLSLEDLKYYLQSGKKRTKPGFFLSFDDGLVEMYDIVRPILLKKGIPAAFFCNSGFIDNKDMFYRYKVSIMIEYLKGDFQAINDFKIIFQERDIFKHLLEMNYHDTNRIHDIANALGINFDDYLCEQKPYMTKVQLCELKKDGFYIGAHSIDHPNYKDINEEQQVFQTNESLQAISDKIKTSERLFAFPFSEYGVQASFFKKINAEFIFGTAGMKNDVETNLLHRIPMEDGNKSAQNVVQNQYLYYILKSIFNKNIRKRI